MSERECFSWGFGHRFYRIWCALFTHDLCRANGHDFYEVRCLRCGLFFRKQP